MAQTLEQFAAQCHKILAAEPGPKGRQKVCDLLKDALQDPGFVAANIPDGTPERKIIYEDKELGFCILAHAYDGQKTSAPHDHGPSWAIYGQAKGVTHMSDYALLQAATPETPGKVRHVRTYKLDPGMAYLYNEGDLHAPRRDGPTRLIRLEGTNMDKVKRLKFELVDKVNA